MPDPAFRDRLAEIIKIASRQYPFGSDIDEGCRGIADAILTSEEWQAREAVVKAAMLRSIELGFVPMPFCEGKYGDRLEYFLELPKGKVVAHFDMTDMHRAKDVLKDHVCIMGNVPSPLLQFGTVKDVEDYCKDLIQYCGKGGGFILTNGSSTDTADPKLVKAMCDSVKKFNVR